MNSFSFLPGCSFCCFFCLLFRFLCFLLSPVRSTCQESRWDRISKCKWNSRKPSYFLASLAALIAAFSSSVFSAGASVDIHLMLSEEVIPPTWRRTDGAKADTLRRRRNDMTPGSKQTVEKCNFIYWIKRAVLWQKLPQVLKIDKLSECCLSFGCDGCHMPHATCELDHSFGVIESAGHKERRNDSIDHLTCECHVKRKFLGLKRRKNVMVEGGS